MTNQNTSRKVLETVSSHFKDLVTSLVAYTQEAR